MNALAHALWQRLEANHGIVLTVVAPREGQPGQAFTGQALHEAARARAASLRAAFAPEAGPLVLAMPCGAEFVVSLLGAFYAGLTAVPVALPRADAQAERFAGIVADCDAAGILCAEGDRAAIERAAGAAPARTARVVTPGLVPDRDRLEMPLAAGARPALIQYTSGSSRFPRGVMVRGENILANAAHCSTAWGLDEHQTVVNWLPHFHDMGLIGGILFPLLAGAPSHQMDPLRLIQRPARWLRLISDTRATFSGGPSFAFSHCLQNVGEAECEGLDLTCWQAAFCGAEPVPADLMAAFRARFSPYGFSGRALYACYGLAEYTLMAAGKAPGKAPGTDAQAPRSGTPGRGRPPAGALGVEPCLLDAAMARVVRIVDPDTGRAIEDGVTGEIWLHGPSRAAGYVGQPDETAEVFENRVGDDPDGGAWLRTGDLGIIAEGSLYVTGRLKDVVTVRGRKVAAAEIEWSAAKQEPALNPLAAAAFMPDERQSGRAVLLIEKRTPRSRLSDADELRRRIRQRVLGTWGIDLTEIRFLERGELPRTSSGKIQRARARAAYSGHPSDFEQPRLRV